MNVIGSFDFGRIIKTLLPGLVFIAALIALMDCAIILLRGSSLITPWIAANTTLAGVMAVPLAITLGLLSNTLFFYVLHGQLIQRPLHSRYPDLLKAEEELRQAAIEEMINELPTPYRSNSLKTATDAGALLLPHMNLSALAITREGFWFYLEFQLNMALGIVFAWLATISTTFIARTHLGLTVGSWIITSVVLSVVSVSLVMMLIGAARMNYYYYRRRLLSLRIAALLNGSKNMLKNELE